MQIPVLAVFLLSYLLSAKKVRNLGNIFYLLLILLFCEKLPQCVTVSTKIPKQLKEKMRILKIKPSKILRKAIEDEIKRKEAEQLRDEIDKLKPILEKVSMEDVIKSIREDRDSR